MLDPGTESIIKAFASPVILAAVMGFISQKYLSKQQETAKSFSDALKKYSDALKAEQVTSAVTKSNTDRTLVLVDEIRKDVQWLRDEHTKTRSSVDAVWRVLDIKRMS